MTATRHQVVVAVAESEAGDTLVGKLRSRFTVRTAYDRENLRDSVDETVDVVILDPDLPDVDPTRLQEWIRSRDLYCQVGLLASGRSSGAPTGVDAVLDERTGEELVRVVARMAARAAYRRSLDRLYALATKRADLVTAGTPEDEREADLPGIERRIERLRAEIVEVLDDLDDETAFEAALGDIEREE